MDQNCSNQPNLQSSPRRPVPGNPLVCCQGDAPASPVSEPAPPAPPLDALRRLARVRCMRFAFFTFDRRWVSPL